MDVVVFYYFFIVAKYQEINRISTYVYRCNIFHNNK